MRGSVTVPARNGARTSTTTGRSQWRRKTSPPRPTKPRRRNAARMSRRTSTSRRARCCTAWASSSLSCLPSSSSSATCHGCGTVASRRVESERESIAVPEVDVVAARRSSSAVGPGASRYHHRIGRGAYLCARQRIRLQALCRHRRPRAVRAAYWPSSTLPISISRSTRRAPLCGRASLSWDKPRPSLICKESPGTAGTCWCSAACCPSRMATRSRRITWSRRRT